MPLTELTAEGTPVLFPSVDKVVKRKNTYLGYKNYELKNHLGNVMATITDRKQSVHIQAVPLVVGDFTRVLSHYQPEVVSISDYYPFGMIMPGRSFNAGNYRYGFQNQEMDNEIKGVGNSINYKYRMHDPRLGRFFSIDPLAAKYPHNSVYAFSENRVIDAVELEGLEKFIVVNNVERGVAITIELGTTGKLGEGILSVQQDVNNNLSAYYNGSINVQANGSLSVEYSGSIDIGKATGNNKQVRNYLIDKSNPLSPQAKGQILTASLRQETHTAFKNFGRGFADNLELTGDALELAGYGTAAIGVGTVATPFLEGGGQILSNVGLGFNLLMDIGEGNYEKAGLRFSINLASGGLSGLTRKTTRGLLQTDPSNKILHGAAEMTTQTGVKVATEGAENELLEYE